MRAKSQQRLPRQKLKRNLKKYRVVQDGLFMSDFDKYMLELE